MANVQKQLEKFDDNIRLKRFNENQTLREKRDAILNRLRERFDVLREQGDEIPTFDTFNQGSYQMGTGIHPADGDYDIDVGVRFNCSTRESDPADLKTRVADALKNHTDLGTRIRRSCVTVYYKQGGEQAYHVDLAVYASDNPESANPRLFLARRQRDSNIHVWEESDPRGLMSWVENRFSDGDDELQFLRVIRALKRWKTEKFKTDGNNAPSGIGLTVAAGRAFSPRVVRDPLERTTTFDDLSAMRALVSAMLAGFQIHGTKDDGSPLYRLAVSLPVPPGKDIFEAMTVGQMTTFRERLMQLDERLAQVQREVDPVDACKLMRKEFGEEFPVPDKSDTGQRGGGGRAVASGGVSA